MVTWPTKTSAMPWLFATRVSCAAHSRTCATDPGADVQRLRVERLDRIDHGDLGLLRLERRRDPLELDLGEQLRRRRCRPAAAAPAAPSAPPIPRRSRRSPCAHALIHASACRSSVDLPMPGSPPISTTCPATSPPPSTRSNSADAGRHARRLLRRDARERRRAAAAFAAPPKRCCAGALGDRLDQRVPGAAVRTLALPLGRLAAALGAGVDAFARVAMSLGALDLRHARGERAQQLVAHGSRGGRDLVARQARRPRA